MRPQAHRRTTRQWLAERRYRLHTHAEQCEYRLENLSTIPHTRQIYYPIFFLAVVGAGAHVAGGNPGHTKYELEHLMSKCSVKFIITEPQLLEKATAAASSCKIDQSRIFLCDGHETYSSDPRSWLSLLQHGENDWDVLSEAEAASTPTAFYSTSGTTGSPKFAAVSHSYQVVSGSYIESEVKTKPYPVSRLVSLPLMHAFAAPLVHCAALRCGTPTYILSRFSVKDFVMAVATFAITEFPVVPSMLIALTSSSLVTPTLLKSVREVMCAGAPLSTSLAATFSSLLTAPSARLVQLYGSTEAGWISSTPWSAANNFPHAASTTSPEFSLHCEATPTVGVPCTKYEMRLIHPISNAPIPGSDTPGILQVNVPHPFLHYLGAEQATKDSFTADGWLETGDIASRDDRGQYYIVDRQKDMIKVRGWQVAPAEIESVVVTHDSVQDCAVIGVEDTVGASGELPWAFVSVKPEAEQLDIDLLRAWIRERLAGYKVPAKIIVIERIPRNPAGKILRRLLRDEHVKPAAPPAIVLPEKKHVAVVVTEVVGPGSVLPSPVNETALQDVLPVWLKGDSVRSWPVAKHGKKHGRYMSLWQDERWRVALTLAIPGAFTIGLCLWRTDAIYDVRRWWMK